MRKGNFNEIIKKKLKIVPIKNVDIFPRIILKVTTSTYHKYLFYDREIRTEIRDHKTGKNTILNEFRICTLHDNWKNQSDLRGKYNVH